MRAFLNRFPWLTQNDFVNGAIASMIGYPDYRIDTAPPTLDDYVRAGAMDTVARDSLRGAIQRRQPIAVVGLHNSGRTSLLRALVHEYQMTPNETRRAMLVTSVPGELKKETPLIAMTLDDPSLRTKGLQQIPDMIESVFTDDLRPAEIPAAIDAWRTGRGGAFTHNAGDLDFEGFPELSAIADVRLLMREGKVVMFFDRLPHENTPAKMRARADAQWESETLDRVFDEVVRHYQGTKRIHRIGPNSGRSRDSMTRRASIIDGAGGVGTLEIATVMVTAAETTRYLTWTANTIAKTSLPSSVSEIHSFDEAVALIDASLQ
jgi:hypothetical protein